MNQMDWMDRKWFKRIMYPLMIAGAILGIVLGVFIGESVGERLAFALIGAIQGGLVIPIIIALLVVFVEGLVVYTKAKMAKSNAYYMIESGQIYPEQFQFPLSSSSGSFSFLLS